MTKFNDDITQNLVSFYSDGLPLKHCASAVGISRDTLYRWMKKGKEAKSGKYHQFYKDMQKARAKFIAYHQKKINDSKDWRASQYLLQVTSPADYVLENKYKIESEQKVEVRSGFDKELFEKILNEYDE